ncbi:MAG: site-specific integrase [Thermacetogeniaceae bacterium]
MKDVKLFEFDAMEVCRLIRENLSGLAPRTQKNIQDTMRTAVKAAIEARVLPQDALLGWKTVRVPRQSRPVLDREGLRRLVEAAEGYKYGLVIRLLAVTGARIGEILGLTWDRVDFKRNAITIDRSVDVLKRELKDEPKTFNSRRTIILDEETMQKLYEHKQRQAKEKGVVQLKKDSRLVFQSPSGKPLKYNAVLYEFKTALKKAGLPEMRIHDIRHSVVALLLSEGVPAITVAALVGHDVATTNEMYAEKVKVTRAIDLKE